MRRREAFVLLALVPTALLAGGAGRAGAAQPAERCTRAVVFSLPGVTWEEIRRVKPPALLAAVEEGAAASLSTRTISSRTSYASGYATIGAGSRIEAGEIAGVPAARPRPEPSLFERARVSGLADLRRLARAAGYGAQPGALASLVGDGRLAAIGNADLGEPPRTRRDYGRWHLLAAMSPSGLVERAAVGATLLERAEAWPFGVRTDPGPMRAALVRALRPRCSVAVIDQGDLVRAEQLAFERGESLPDARRRALLAADRVLASTRRSLDPSRDLLLVVSPTSPAWKPEARLGVALAIGPGFPPGATLSSASTRRDGIVTLPDVAPTVVAHLGREVPTAMTGRPFFPVPTARADRITAAIELDRESAFVDDLKGDISTGFVAFQVVVYVAIMAILARTERRSGPARYDGPWHRLELAALAVVAFPVTTYLVGVLDAHALGVVGFVALLAIVDVALVAAVSWLFADALDRLLSLTALTTAVILADLLLGARLQLNTVFGYSPIVAGRFAGAGNIAFAVVGTTSLLTGALVLHRWPRARVAPIAVGGLFAATVAIEGAPPYGSDVGGVIALVPALGITWLLLSGRRPTPRLVVGAIVLAIGVLGAFLALDLARPPDERTHLARLFEDVSDRGGQVLVDTVARKARANLRVFASTIWTFFVPPAVGALAWLLRRPRGRWERLARTYPKLRAGLVGGLLLAILGFAVNDSGIVVPAVVLSLLVPMALLTHLSLDRREAEAAPSYDDGMRVPPPDTAPTGSIT